MRPGTRQTATSDAHSASGMVTTPHWLASEAGARVLARGGTAIEALVAAGAVLSVVYPHFCGLGGDAVWMVADATGKAKACLGIGQAAANVGEPDSIPVRGPGSMLTTACLVDSWGAVLAHSAREWGGTETLPLLLQDAIRIAEDGFDVSKSQAFWWQFRKDELATWPGFGELFRADGRQLQPALARTLKRIAENGARDFYEGELARDIADGLQKAGSPLTGSDLALTRTRICEPARLSYRDVELLAPPPPTQGITTLGIMGVLRHFRMDQFEVGSADFYHHLVEAVKRAFGDRHHIADPAFAPDPTERLLDPAHLATNAASINPAEALPWPQPFRQGDTALLAAVDPHGNCASLLQSLYFDWGSGVVLSDTGILWQNRGAGFSTDPKSPNVVQPGKLPFYTLNPCLALKDGRPHLLIGTQGADGQPQTLALLLSLLIDHTMDPLSALSRPRFLLGRTFSDTRESLKLEAGLEDHALDRLAAMGHDLSGIPAFSPLGGQAGIIRIRADGSSEGAHDPRSDGGAIGL